MARINKSFVIERNVGKKSWQDWYLVKVFRNNVVGINVGRIYLPNSWLGKRVQVKLEEVEDKEKQS